MRLANAETAGDNRSHFQPPGASVTEEQNNRARLIVSTKIRALLARHGIADPQLQLASLMTVLSASHSQVYRKLSGRSSWLEEDLLRIAEHHGETLGSLFGEDTGPAPAAHAQATDTSGPAWHAAGIDIGGTLSDCRVTLSSPGDDTNEASPHDLWLAPSPQGHVVVRHSQIKPGAQALGRVHQLQMDFSRPKQGGIAVFDDDPDVAESITDNLLARGLEAQAFFTTSELKASARRFDAYIIDWFSSDTSTARDLIEHIRKTHAPQATIVVLTGQIQRGHAESDLAELILTHDVLVELKPMRVELLLAKINHHRQA